MLENPELSPWHFLRHYVAQTSSLPEGSLVLRSLKPPFAPLSSDRIASITKNLLKKFGVPTAVWTAHSTRGASVQFYKNLGLTSEEVCELGQWKNTQAFTQHYLRLGAHRVASQKIKGFVHRVSQGLEAEPEGSPTPPKKDRGGRGPKGEAERNCEPTLPTQGGQQGPPKDKARIKFLGLKRARSPQEVPEIFLFAARRTPSPSLKR